MFAGAIRTTTNADSASFKSRAGNCILITIAVICICILVACGVVIVREYALGIGYEPTTCKVANVTILERYQECKYCDVKEKAKKGKDTCTISRFPCAQVLVNYTNSDIKHQGILHPNSLHAIGNYRQCSFEVCLRTKQENEEKVHEFMDGWKKRGHGEFSCFYNVDAASNSLIEHKKHTKQQVIHSMLWPSLVIIICGAIFLKLEMDRRKLTCCGTQDDQFMTKTGSDGRSCNGKNTVASSNVKTHHSLEHLADFCHNKTDYRSTGSKSLTSLEKIEINGKFKHNSKQPLLSKQQQNILQASCTDAGGVKNVLLKSHSEDQSKCLIPEITIDKCGTSVDSVHKGSHSETLV